MNLLRKKESKTKRFGVIFGLMTVAVVSWEAGKKIGDMLVSRLGHPAPTQAQEPASTQQ